MPKNLRSEIQAIAETFVRGVFEAILASPVDELGSARLPSGGASTRREARGSQRAQRPLGGRAAAVGAPSRAPSGRGKPGRRPRELDAGALERVVSTLRANPGGLRSEQLRSVTGIPKPELVRVLKHALAARKITKRGEKRTTTYFVRG
jgi:hypothetical protein